MPTQKPNKPTVKQPKKKSEPTQKILNPEPTKKPKVKI
jgi:hypothetical protein